MEALRYTLLLAHHHVEIWNFICGLERTEKEEFDTSVAVGDENERISLQMEAYTYIKYFVMVSDIRYII